MLSLAPFPCSFECALLTLGCRDALLAGALFFLARGFRSPHFLGVFGLPLRISPLSLRLPLATIFDALAQALQLYKSAVSRRVDARHNRL